MSHASQPPPTTLHRRVLDSLGADIVDGRFEPGSAFTIETLEARLQVSRSVLREVLRVLESKGMVTSRRRVGIQIRPIEEWNLFDPQIIHWRLEASQVKGQLRSLIELRLAIEPEAARLAAQRSSLIDARELMALAGRVWEAGHSSDLEAFIEADISLHRIVLAASGNEMFARLDSLLGEQISGRARLGHLPPEHDPRGLQMHIGVANAIQTRNAEAARDQMLGIIELAVEQMSYLWTDDGLQPPVRFNESERL